MNHQMLMQGSRVRGALTGEWYRVTVSCKISYDHKYSTGDLVALTSGQLKRETDSMNVQCSQSNPMLVSHVEVT